jgi:ABC-type hemin transport system substrate-binding protein
LKRLSSQALSTGNVPMAVRSRHLLWTAICALFVVGCAGPTTSADVPSTRWVSLSPAITETLAAIGATDALVGRSDWCLEPEDVRSLPALGTTLTPNLEGIAGLRPTRIFVEHGAHAQTASLRSLAPTEALPWLTLEQVTASTLALGNWADRTEEAATLTGQLAAALSVDAPQAPAPRTLLVLAAQGLDKGEVWYLRRNSLHGAALHAAGARNAVPEDVSGRAVLSVEQLIALDPDVIVLLRADAPDAAVETRLLEDWARLTPLAAVREGQIHVLSHKTLLSVGPGILSFAGKLGEILEGASP